MIVPMITKEDDSRRQYPGYASSKLYKLILGVFGGIIRWNNLKLPIVEAAAAGQILQKKNGFHFH